MTDAPTSPALARIRAAHDAWARLAATDGAIAAAQAAPRAVAQAQAELPGRDVAELLAVVAPEGGPVSASAYRQLHLAADAAAYVQGRRGGPPAEAACRLPDGAIDLAAFDRLSWEVFELEAAVRALPPAWPGRGSLAGVAAAWRAPHEALRADAARGHVAAILGRPPVLPPRPEPDDAAFDALLADLGHLAFWAPKLAPEDADAQGRAIAEHAAAAVEALLRALERATPDLAARRPQVQQAADDAPLRAFEDAFPRRARVLAERLADPRTSGAWGEEAARAAWRDRAEAAAAELEGPLGELALDWAEAALGRLEAGGAGDVLRVQEWLQRVPQAGPRLEALVARCTAQDPAAGRMWRDRRMNVIHERMGRPGAPSIADDAEG